MHDGQGAPWRRGEGRIGGMGVGALSVCTLQQEIAGKVTGALTQDGAPRCLWAACPLIGLSLFVSPKLMSQRFHTCSLLAGQRERSFVITNKGKKGLNDFVSCFSLQSLSSLYLFSERNVLLEVSFHAALIQNTELLQNLDNRNHKLCQIILDSLPLSIYTNDKSTTVCSDAKCTECI